MDNDNTIDIDNTIEREEPTRSRVLRPKTILGLVVLVLVGMVLAGPVGAGAGAAGGDGDQRISPRTKVYVPAENAVVGGGDLVAVGTATHPVGIAGVRVVVKNLDDDTYWNGSGWQAGFVRTEAAIGALGYGRTVWWVQVPEAALQDGQYRVRGFSYSVEGNGDAFGGDLNDFTYGDSSEPAPVAPTTSTTQAPGPEPTTGEPPTTEPGTTEPSPTTTNQPTTTGQPTTTDQPTTTNQPPTTQPAPTTSTTQAPPTTPAPAPPPSGCGDRSILVPCTGMLLGSTGDFTAADGSSQSNELDFRRQEARLGQQFDVFHEYNQWRDLTDRAWPNGEVQRLADEGRTIFTNWKSPTSHPRDWAQIAAGQYDADIRAAAAQIIDFGDPVFITFFHEPEDNIKQVANGNTATENALVADYAAAWARIVQVFDAEGADNAIWVWNVQGFLGHDRLYEAGLYPGDDVIDWVAYNSYNWHGCDNHGDSRNWREFDVVYRSFYDWLEADGPGRPGLDKPLMLGEWGSEENDGNATSDQTKAEWFGDARQHLADGTFPRIKAAIYFDTEGVRSDGSVQFCRWSLDSSQASLNAFRALMADPALEPTWN